MNWTRQIFLVSFASLIVCCSESPAQLIRVLELDEAHSELALTEEQIDQATDIVKIIRQETLSIRRKLGGGLRYAELSSVEQKEFDEKFVEHRQRLDAKQKSLITGLLTEEQFARLQQLRIQAFGAAGFLGGEIAEKLEITDEQKDAIRMAGNEFQTVFREEKQQQVADGSLLTGADKLAIQAKLIKEFNSRLVEVMLGTLTEEQQAKYNEMRGELVDIPVLQQLR